MHSTTAFSGGFMYRPTTSTSFSSKSGSLDSLKVSTRWGWIPRANQIRCTVEGDTPARLAIDRQLQCVSPGGVSCKVSRTISSTFSTGIDGFGPRPGRTAEKFCRPSSENRSRHAATVAGETWTSLAILVVANPSAAINNARARKTSRCGAVRERISFSSTDRCSSVMGSAGVAARIPHSTSKPHLNVRQSTSSRSPGFDADDIAWLLDNAEGQIVVLRPSGHDEPSPALGAGRATG